MADCGAATVRIVFPCLFTNKMSLSQIVSIEFVTLSFFSCSHDLANTMMSTKNACAVK